MSTFYLNKTDDRGRGGGGGMTMVEMVVVFGVIGILALATIPAFRVFQPNLELSSAARDLATDLRYAQQLAVTEQVEHGIYFSTTTNEYQIIRFGAIEEILETKELPDKVSFQEVLGFTGYRVKFNPYGAAQESGNIALINTKNSTTTVEIRPSGFVKIIK